MKSWERDRYIFLFEHKDLNRFIEQKFELLDRVREISIGNKTPATISIGIGTGGDTDCCKRRVCAHGSTCRWGRGGDQAVIKDESQFRFYGGKTKEHEKSTRVKSRVVAYALRQLIMSEDKVVIMGHKSPDMDSIGAAIGLSRGVKNRKKPVYIVCGECSHTASRIVHDIQSSAEENKRVIYIAGGSKPNCR